MVMWAQIDMARKEQFCRRYEAGDDLSGDAIELGVRLESLQRYIRNHRQHRDIFRVTQALAKIPIFPVPSKTPVFDTYLDIETDDAIITGDIEVPDHSRAYLLQVLYTAMAHNIKTLVIAGDFVATDMGPLNSWPTTWLANDLGYDESCTLACHILNQMSMWFEHIYIIEGNHDLRIARATHGQIHLGMELRTTKAIYSRYEYMWLRTVRGDVKISHPKNYSRNPVTLGQKLHSVEPRKCHYIIAHCHRVQFGMSLDGLHEIHTLGTGRDPARTKYVSKSDTNHPAWDSAFLMMRGGYFTPLGDKFTNWPEHLADFYDDYMTALNPPTLPSSALKIVKPKTSNGNKHTLVSL